jgi:hypothetical protein
MELSELQRLKQVEDENRRLKHIVAEQTLDIQAPKAVDRSFGCRTSKCRRRQRHRLPWFRHGRTCPNLTFEPRCAAVHGVHPDFSDPSHGKIPPTRAITGKHDWTSDIVLIDIGRP